MTTLLIERLTKYHAELLTVDFFPSLVSWLDKEKNVTVTVEELCNVFSFPVPDRRGEIAMPKPSGQPIKPSARVAKSEKAVTCQHVIHKRGTDETQTCPKPPITGSSFCRLHNKEKKNSQERTGVEKKSSMEDVSSSKNPQDSKKTEDSKKPEKPEKSDKDEVKIEAIKTDDPDIFIHPVYRIRMKENPDGLYTALDVQETDDIQSRRPLNDMDKKKATAEGLVIIDEIKPTKPVKPSLPKGSKK